MRPITFLWLTSIFCFGVAGLYAQQQDSTRTVSRIDSTTDAALEAQLKKALSGRDSSRSIVDRSRSGRQDGGQRRTLNPDISVVGSFVGAATESNAAFKTLDSGLSEAEISFQGYVDAYSKADFYVAFRRESEDPFAGPDPEVAASGEYEAELEEAFLTSLSLPYGLQIKAGKFRSNLGKINQTHPHALNFLDLPRMYVNFFGEEGLADRGFGINWLVPNGMNFFQELTVEITSGALEGPSFSPENNHLLYLGHLKNFFDLSPDNTLELGFSGIYGANSENGDKTQIAAVDLTYRWKPLRHNRLKSFELIAEALLSRRDTPAGDVNSRAMFAHAQYQFAPRWFVGGRFDFSEFPEISSINEKAYSVNLNFYATEFQKLELQLQRGLPAAGDEFTRALIRAVFVIGAHGAHKY